LSWKDWKNYSKTLPSLVFAGNKVLQIITLLQKERNDVMSRIISVDSGRQFVKALSGGKRKLFQSVVAPAPERFNLEIKDNPEDFVINQQGEGNLIGGLALRQSTSAIQERSTDKSNRQNILLVLTACSLFAEPGEKITLLTNCPARDWRTQRERLWE